MSSRRVKCSYQDCFRYFANEKDMKTHKKKEPSHEYCHRCDVDCQDDSELLIHMIESGRHIVCPMCGVEFKSNAGLESHIPQAHQRVQNLECIGCGEKFTRAAGLMHHIESDECTVISQEVFERRRAEKAIAKDAWASQLKPDEADNAPRGNVSAFSDADTNEHGGGVSLLDQDNRAESNAHSSSQHDHLAPSLQMLALREQFPALPDPNLLAKGQQQPFGQENRKILMSFEGDGVSGGKDGFKPAGSASSPATSNLFTDSRASLQSQGLDHPNVPSASAAPKAPLSTNPDSHLSTKPAPLIPAPILDHMSYFNDLTNKFECPGRKCGGIFDSIEAFNDHLTSSAHVGGRTVCPSCLSKFSTTMALVAHCESPSKRCNIRNSANYNQVLREITGGLIGAEGHHIDGSVRYVANDISKPGFW